MSWKDDFLARLKKDRAQIQQGLEWLRTGKLDVGEVSSGGRMESRKAETIAQYEGIIAQLDPVIADLERES